jgi:hypothetical protein
MGEIKSVSVLMGEGRFSLHNSWLTTTIVIHETDLNVIKTLRQSFTNSFFYIDFGKIICLGALYEYCIRTKE